MENDNVKYKIREYMSKNERGVFTTPSTLHPPPSQKKGMTTLEITIALAIVVLIGALIMIPFVRFKNNQLLVSGTEQVVSALREARANTLDGSLCFKPHGAKERQGTSSPIFKSLYICQQSHFQEEDQTCCSHASWVRQISRVRSCYN